MKWIIAANTNSAHIYQYKAGSVNIIKDIHHEENKLKNSELAEDRTGQYSSHNIGSSYSPRKDPEEVLVENFAREIAALLEEGFERNEFNELIVIMPAQMEGLVHKSMHKNVKGLIKKTLHKNLMHLSEKEMGEYLKINL